MPVLNGEAVIARALDDLLAQTFDDFSITVCDNASQDRTVEIVARYAAKDNRVQLISFGQRVDIMQSFKRAYDNAIGEYFVFAPADDRWYPRFLEQNIAVLESDDSLVTSTGRVAFTLSGRFSHISTGTRPLLGRVRQNLASYLADPVENARAFGLFRRSALEGAFPEREYPGWDFQMIARTLSHGRHFEIPRVLAERDATPYATYLRHAEAYYGRSPMRVFPLYNAAMEIWRDPRIPKSISLAGALSRLVAGSHISYSAVRMPRWHRMIAPVFGRRKRTRDAGHAGG